MHYSSLYQLKIMALFCGSLSLCGLYVSTIYFAFYVSRHRPLEVALAELAQIRQEVAKSQQLFDSYLKGQQTIVEKLAIVQEKIADQQHVPATTRQVPTIANGSANEIADVLKRYRTADTRTDLDPASDFLDYMSKKVGRMGPVPSFADVAESVVNFLGSMAYQAGKDGIDELTKMAICHFWPGSCQTSPPVIVALTINNTAPHGKPSHSTTSLNLHTSIWYAKSDSVDDLGEVERTVLPLIARHVGARADCIIFVDGNADTVGADSHNIALSERRARAVAKSLIAHLDGAVRVEISASSERNAMKITRDHIADIYNRRTDIHLSCG